MGKTTMAAATATWLSDQLQDFDRGYRPYHQSIGHLRTGDLETEVVPIDSSQICRLNINPKKAMGVFQSRMEEMMQGFSTLFGSDLLSTPCTERSPLSISL